MRKEYSQGKLKPRESEKQCDGNMNTTMTQRGHNKVSIAERCRRKEVVKSHDNQW